MEANMLNATRDSGYYRKHHHEPVRHRQVLSGVTDAFVRSHGFRALLEPDTPAFMRRLCGVDVEWPRQPAIEAETPGPVTRLLETLFSCVLGDAFPMEETAGIRTCQ